MQNVKKISCIAWHPSGSLFVAWELGPFCYWSEETNETFSIESPHQATITLFKFSPKGSRLISADTVRIISFSFLNIFILKNFLQCYYSWFVGRWFGWLEFFWEAITYCLSSSTFQSCIAHRISNTIIKRLNYSQGHAGIQSWNFLCN